MNNSDIESEIRRLVAAANDRDQVDRAPKQISCRVDAVTHHKLDVLADKVNLTRTGLAERLLEQATAIAWTAAGFPELAANEIGEANPVATTERTDKSRGELKQVAEDGSSFSRINCINVAFGHLGQEAGVARDSGAIAASRDGSTRICCLTSKDYALGKNGTSEERYWFTIYERQLDEIRLGQRAFVVLGCGSITQIIVIPAEKFVTWTTDLPPYTRGGTGWHIHLRKSCGRIELRREGRRESPIDVTQFLI